MTNCHPKLIAQIEEDLSHWPSISKEMISDSLSKGFHLHIKIISNTLHILKNIHSYETRNESIVKVLNALIMFRRVPNCELVLDCQDGRWADLEGESPAFVMAKPATSKNILYPDFTFGGWPEVSVLPWPDSIAIAVQKNKSILWDQKIEKLFFRGANTNPIRNSVHLMSQINPDIFDCQLMSWQKTDRLALQGSSTYTPIYDHGRYKYLINLPGNTYSSRLKYLFLFNSLAIHVDNGWIEFWYKLLENENNCLIVNPEQIAILLEKIHILKNNDSQAKRIAEKGTQLILNNLSYETILDYWQLLLTLYSERLDYEIKL